MKTKTSNNNKMTTKLLTSLCILALLFIAGNAHIELEASMDGMISTGKEDKGKDKEKGGAEKESKKDKGNDKKTTLKMSGGGGGIANSGAGLEDEKDALGTTAGSKGKWELFKDNSGVSAMHMILLPTINKVLMFDSTIWLISQIKLPEGSKCHPIRTKPGEVDCWAHSVLMDVQTGELRPLLLMTDTWCSSGALALDGTLVSTGGYQAGANSARYLGICPNCEWREYDNILASERWYSTQVTLGDGRFMVFGGRNFQTYEFVPQEGQTNKAAVPFQFLKDTLDPFENNLYPFVYLAPDGNLFVFANNRSIILDPNSNKVLYEFPIFPGASRNYPAGGASTLLPLILQPNDDRQIVPAEVLICGGAPHDAYYWANEIKPKKFRPANNECGRIDITQRNSKWIITRMPSRRVMGDAMLLPTGDVLILNGCKQGSAGWDNARDPNLIPILYQTRQKGRIVELQGSEIPRMYHSTAAILPDAKVLVAGSNTNNGYIFDALFPTELRVEKFSPPYLEPARNAMRPQIMLEESAPVINYGKKFNVQAKISELNVDQKKLEVVIYSPPFTTHGVSMNQRLVNLGIVNVNDMGPGVFNIEVSAPRNGNIAPPGYYMLFVNNAGVPSESSIWVQLTK